MNSKKFLAGVLAAAMALSLTACGGGDSSTPSTSTPDASTGDSSTPAADGALTIKVGGIGPLTGSTATYGVATHYGAQVAVDEINALDSDIKLELRFEDDTGVNETGVSAYNTLKDWDVDVIYGTTTTGPCVAVAAETFADRYFQLTPSASSPDVTDGKDNVFQMCFTDPNQGLTAANYVADNNLATKVAVIYNNGDAYSTGIAQGFIAQAAERGLEVVTEQTFPADTTTDFNVQLAACRDGGAELVFMPIYYGPASLVLQQANAMGYDPQFFGGDGMDGILAIEGFDTSLAEGLMLLTPFNGPDRSVCRRVRRRGQPDRPGHQCGRPDRLRHDLADQRRGLQGPHGGDRGERRLRLPVSIHFCSQQHKGRGLPIFFGGPLPRIFITVVPPSRADK